jgi:hypothetical protein
LMFSSGILLKVGGGGESLIDSHMVS